MIKYFKRNSLLKQLYFDRSELSKILILSSAFSCCLAVTRVVYTGEPLFIFLIWNLFLAYIPLAITDYISKHVRWIENNIKFFVVFICWLLFIPNSFYIITDLFHLGVYNSMPLWFDLALILSFAWNGLLLGFLSVQRMEKIMGLKYRISNEILFIYPVMWLSALGIYIGRYLRFNSWDVISNPFALMYEVMELIQHPVQYRFEWSMIFCFSILMTVMYASVKRISKEVSITAT